MTEDVSFFIGPADSSTIDQLSKELIDLRLDLDIIKEHIKTREEQLTALIDEEVGVTAIKGDEYTVEITRNEVLKWDSEGLLNHFYGGALKLGATPLDITGKISKASFAAMTTAEQNDLIKYLERKPGPAKIKITENEDINEL